MTKLHLSPSKIAKYFFHDCETFLIEHAKPKHAQTRTKEVESDPLMDAIRQQGHQWEEDAIQTHLKHRTVHIADIPGPLSDRYHNVEQSLALLRNAAIGDFIYQPTLEVPSSFYNTFNLDPTQAHFGQCRPDLIEVVAHPKTGNRLLRVIDLKRGVHLKSHYVIQIALYALFLKHIISTHQIEQLDVDLEHGAIWLGHHDAMTMCHVGAMIPHLTQFLKQTLPSLLDTPDQKLGWHRYSRCQWCACYDHCTTRMHKEQDLSMLVGLHPRARAILTNTLNINTLGELDHFLQQPNSDATLNEHALLQGQSHNLRAQLSAFSTQSVVCYGTASITLPKPTTREISLMLTVQSEPLGKRAWMWGFAMDTERYVPNALCEQPRLFIAQTPDHIEATRAQFINTLHDVLSRIDVHNHQHPWSEQLNLQLYTYTKLEYDVLIEELINALDEPQSRKQAISLLLYLHSPQSLQLDQQADDLSSTPMVTLLETMRQLLALPVATSYQLPHVLCAFGDTSYPHDPRWHHRLGHGLRAQAIHDHWNTPFPEQIEHLKLEGIRLLDASLKVLAHVREAASTQLMVYAPKFQLPMTSGIEDPIVRKLAFFAQYECSLQARQARLRRMAPLVVQRQLETVIEVQAVDAKRFDILSPNVELVEDTFKSFLMVPDSPAGRLAQLSFDDEQHHATYPWKLPKHDHRAVIAVKRAHTDELGFTHQIEVSTHKSFLNMTIEPGMRFLLYKRYSNGNTSRIVSFLQALDKQPLGLYRQLLHDPLVASRKAPYPQDIEDHIQAMAPSLDLTPSKLSAFETMRGQQVTALWGPPGTGKTHFLAATILALSKAHARTNRPFRVLITAFTHAAIENVLLKLTALQDELPILDHQLSCLKAKAWKGITRPDTIGIAKKNKLTETLEQLDCVVLGATIYATMELDETNFEGFDLVVMDEASQVEVPLAAVPTRLVKNKGRLVFAGDHLQLAPIVTGTYPEPKEGEPLLHRSIFEMLLSMTGEQSHVVATLLENFRMNDVLTSYAAHLLYPPEYTCINEASASRRCVLKAHQTDNDLLDHLLDPHYPMTLVLLDSLHASNISALEAELTAELVCTLRDHLLTDAGGTTYETDEHFFQKGCFVVSPHHAQLRLIRRALQTRRDFDSPPFVDTVDKMQGQEAECVIVSYGVGDADAAAREAAFIYNQNRLNVAITRAKSKTIVMLSRALIHATPQAIEDSEVAEGLGYMRRLCQTLEAQGTSTHFEHQHNGLNWHIEVLRTADALQPQNLTEGPPPLDKTKKKTSKNQAAIGFEAKLWEMADALRGSMDAGEYKHYVLGMIFLKYISDAFIAQRQAIENELTDPDHIDYMDPTDYDSDEAYQEDLKDELEDVDAYMAANVFWVPEQARWDAIKANAKSPKIGVFIDDAMKLIEDANPETLKGILPKIYGRPSMDTKVLGKLVDLVTNIEMVDQANKSKDILGRVYEYFLGQFADSEGKRGGQFYTPKSIVQTLVELIEPLHGRIYDPCCGSGGMFVQSIRFVESHGGQSNDVSIYGQESNPTTWKLAQMNLAIRGISADLGQKHGDTLHDDLHRNETFDYIMANPPFNISDWSGELLEKDERWKGYATPQPGNANYAWILHIVHHLNAQGVAGIVMANGSMSSTSNNEGEIRKQLIENNLVDCMVAMPTKLFYNVQIPSCIWVLAKHRTGNDTLRNRTDEILFIDARKMGQLETAKHRIFTDEDISLIGDTYHNWRSKDGQYEDVAGFCKAASMEEVEQHDFVLTPGRFVGVEEEEEDNEIFSDKIETLGLTLEHLMKKSNELDITLFAVLKEVGYGSK